MSVQMRITAFPSELDLASLPWVLVSFGAWMPTKDSDEESGCRLFVKRSALEVQGDMVRVRGNAYTQTGPSEYRRVGFLEGSYPHSGMPAQAEFNFEKGGK